MIIPLIAFRTFAGQFPGRVDRCGEHVMGTGAETQEQSKGGASQSRDVIPELCFSCAHEPIDSNSKAIATLPTWGQFFSNFKSDIWHIKYLVNADQLQRRQMVQCGNTPLGSN
jgi:hypothetical protein